MSSTFGPFSSAGKNNLILNRTGSAIGQPGCIYMLIYWLGSATAFYISFHSLLQREILLVITDKSDNVVWSAFAFTSR